MGLSGNAVSPPSRSHKRKRNSQSSAAGKKSKRLRSRDPISLLALPPRILNDIIEHCVALADAECYRVAESTNRNRPCLNSVFKMMSADHRKYGSTLSRDTRSLLLACKVVHLHVMAILLREIRIHFTFGFGFPFSMPCKATIYSAAKLNLRLVRKVCIRVDDSSSVQGWNWALNKMEFLGQILHNVRVVELQLQKGDQVPALPKVHKTIGDYIQPVLAFFRHLDKVELSGHPTHEWVMEIRKSTHVRVEIRSASRPWAAEALCQTKIGDEMVSDTFWRGVSTN